MTDNVRENRNAGTRHPASLADMVVVAEKPSLRNVFTPLTITKILVLAALFFWLYHRDLTKLWVRWWEPNWSHGFLIPLFSLFLLYVRGREMLSAKRRICLWGLVLVVMSIVIMVFATFPYKVNFFRQLTMITLLLGLVLYLGGPGILRVAWLPIVYLVFAIPIPDRIYTEIALPLQNLAARVSTVMLQMFGVTVKATASNLRILSRGGHWHSLTVAEACSGVRSLTAFLAIGVGLAYVEDHPIWHRLVLVAATIPVAILCNVLRVTGTCTMYVIDRPELGQDFMHTFMGLLLLPPALLMLLLINWLLNSFFIESDGEEEDSAESQQSPKDAAA